MRTCLNWGRKDNMFSQYNYKTIWSPSTALEELGGITKNSEKIEKPVENTHAYATLHWKTSLKGHMKYTTWAD